MYITIKQEGREFKAHLHFAVLDDWDFLIAASFAGNYTAVKAVEASIIYGLQGAIELDTGEVIPVRAKFGEYRRGSFVHENGVVHGMVISKKAVFADNRDFPDPVVIAPDGDLETAVGRMLAARYLLPGEWVNEYAGLVRGYFARLRVIADPRYPQWQNIAAVQFAGLSDELVHKRLESALKNNRRAAFF
jgi:hypothetical protein